MPRPSQGGEHKPLSRPGRRRKVIRELASNDYTKRELAEKYNVSLQAVHQFARRHAEEIAAVREDWDNEFAGMWIANKANRLDEYSRQVEMVHEYLAEYGIDEDSPQFLRLQQAALKAVAEELGQIPSKMQISLGDKKITYTIEGVDLDHLK